MPDLGVVMVVEFGVRWRGGRAAAGHCYCFLLFSRHVMSLSGSRRVAYCIKVQQHIAM